MRNPGVFTRVLLWLIPDRFTKDAEEAEKQAKKSSKQLAKVEAQGRKVDHLVHVLRADRLENHYAERVRAAYAGKRKL